MTTENSVSSVSETKASKPASKPSTKSSDKPLLIGLDLGTNTSFIIAETADSQDYSVSQLLPSVVGYVGDGIVQGILPSDAQVFFGDEAIENKLHLQLVWPLRDGLVSNARAAKDLLLHMRSLVNPERAAEIRAVIGMPANATAESREALRAVVTGVFDRVLFIPEPFLAALGNRDEKLLGTKDYVDPVQNSLFVDIGAGTTDLCLVQGYFPKAEDQISFPVAGDKIDDMIRQGIERVYPDLKLSQLQIREIKESHSYVGASRGPIEQKVIVAGKGQTIEVSEAVGFACNQLLDMILDAVKKLIARAPSDSIVHLMQNILITGGGSQIQGIDTELQRRLVDEGYESPQVCTVGSEYKRFVGIGAIKAAQAARENQWQILFK